MTRVGWLTVLRSLWVEIWERDVEAHRRHLEDRLTDPATSLIGHRIAGLLMVAFGVVLGFGLAVAVAW